MAQEYDISLMVQGSVLTRVVIVREGSGGAEITVSEATVCEVLERIDGETWEVLESWSDGTEILMASSPCLAHRVYTIRAMWRPMRTHLVILSVDVEPCTNLHLDVEPWKAAA